MGDWVSTGEDSVWPGNAESSVTRREETLEERARCVAGRKVHTLTGKAVWRDCKVDETMRTSAAEAPDSADFGCGADSVALALSQSGDGHGVGESKHEEDRDVDDYDGYLQAKMEVADRLEGYRRCEQETRARREEHVRARANDKRVRHAVAGELLREVVTAEAELAVRQARREHDVGEIAESLLLSGDLNAALREGTVTLGQLRRAVAAQLDLPEGELRGKLMKELLTEKMIEMYHRESACAPTVTVEDHRSDAWYVSEELLRDLICEIVMEEVMEAYLQRLRAVGCATGHGDSPVSVICDQVGEKAADTAVEVVRNLIEEFDDAASDERRKEPRAADDCERSGRKLDGGGRQGNDGAIYKKIQQTRGAGGGSCTAGASTIGNWAGVRYEHGRDGVGDGTDAGTQGQQIDRQVLEAALSWVSGGAPGWAHTDAGETGGAGTSGESAHYGFWHDDMGDGRVDARAMTKTAAATTSGKWGSCGAHYEGSRGAGYQRQLRGTLAGAFRERG